MPLVDIFWGKKWSFLVLYDTLSYKIVIKG